MIEAGVVLDRQGLPAFWHLPDGRSACHLPDSRNLWNILWSERDHISGFAHTHPGDGICEASSTDLTTFAAIEAALGRRLDWWIVNAGTKGVRHTVLYRWEGATPGNYVKTVLWTDAFPWVRRLRELSIAAGGEDAEQ